MKKSSFRGYGNETGDSQNVNNLLGSRPCVRQSRLYREGCSGNAMKDILGQADLKWDTTRTQGCYQGGHVYDHNTQNNLAVQDEGEEPVPQDRPAPAEAEDEEIEVEVVGNESSAPDLNQEAKEQPKAEAPPRVSASTGRGFRPCSGMANQQTYNIFTGE